MLLVSQVLGFDRKHRENLQPMRHRLFLFSSPIILSGTGKTKYLVLTQDSLIFSSNFLSSSVYSSAIATPMTQYMAGCEPAY